MARLRRWWPVLLLALVPLLPLWRAIFLGEAIGPWDQFRAMAPWYGPTPRDPWDVLQADAVLQFAPWRTMVFDAWSRGELPLWNPYQLLGTPLLANSQSAGFYPPHILAGVLRIPPYVAMTLLAWAHLAWAGLGVLWLVKRLGGSTLGGVVAGVSFSLSAFMLAWTPLPSVISTVSWIPWLLGCVVALFFSPHRGRVGFLSFAVAMMLLAGHLQFAAYGLFAALVLALWLAFMGGEQTISTSLSPIEIERRDDVSGTVDRVEVDERVEIRSRRRLLIAPLVLSVACIALGAMIAAPQVLPSLSLARQSHRQAVAGEEGYASYLRGALQPEQLLGAVFPSALGHPRQHAEAFPGVSSYWPAFFRPGANYAESAFAIGPLVLALLLFVRRRSWREPAVGALALVGVLGVLVAFGTPVNRLLYFGVPGWAASGSPGRASVLIVLAACVLAGVGASRLLEDPPQKWKQLLHAIGVVVLAMAFVVYEVPIAWMDLPDPYRLDKGATNAIANAILRASDTIALAGLATIALLVLALRKPRWTSAALVAAPLLLAPALFEWQTPIATGKPVTRPVWDIEGRVAAINDDWQLLARPNAVLPPNLPTLFGLQDVAGYDSLIPRETKQLLDSVNGRDSAPAANGNMLAVKSGADWRALASLGVVEVWSREPIRDLGRPIERRRDFVRHSLAGAPRASTRLGPAIIEHEGYDCMRVRVTGPATLVVRDRNAPGWTAAIDGRSVPISGELWREVDVPEGEHTVQFRYRPRELTLGLGLFVLAAGTLALTSILTKPRTV